MLKQKLKKRISIWARGTSLCSNLYTSEGCIMVSKFHNCFAPIGLNIFCRFFRPSGLQNDKWQKCLCVCESVTKTKVEPLLYLNMFQPALILVHMFTDMVPRDDFFFSKILITINFIRFFFVFFGLIQFLRWNTDHVQIDFLWVLWVEWPILRLFYFVRRCAVNNCVFFEISHFFMVL